MSIIYKLNICQNNIYLFIFIVVVVEHVNYYISKFSTIFIDFYTIFIILLKNINNVNKKFNLLKFIIIFDKFNLNAPKQKVNKKVIIINKQNL